MIWAPRSSSILFTALSSSLRARTWRPSLPASLDRPYRERNSRGDVVPSTQGELQDSTTLMAFPAQNAISTDFHSLQSSYFSADGNNWPLSASVGLDTYSRQAYSCACTPYTLEEHGANTTSHEQIPSIQQHQTILYPSSYTVLGPQTRKRNRTAAELPSDPSQARKRYRIAVDFPRGNELRDERAALPLQNDENESARRMQSPIAPYAPQCVPSMSRNGSLTINRQPQAHAANPARIPSDAQPLHHHHRLPVYRDSNLTGQNTTNPQSREAAQASEVDPSRTPLPITKPRPAKLRFTREDDALLVELKETKDLTWKQIATHFPDRSAGTLQVRYCTKLKAKTNPWSDEMIQRLRNAVQDYDDNRWRVISAKVGNGISATACRAKTEEMEELEIEEESWNEESDGV